MEDDLLKPGARWRFMPLAILMIALILVARAFSRLGTVMDSFVRGDNDDIMRLMEVRDWLAGQGWFDMQQYRILPPEGVPMHWSRYVDAGLGGLLRGLELVFPPDLAERLMLVLWPTLLLAILLLIVGRGTWRVLGPVASVLAMMLVLLWNPVADITFKIGRIDHHNVQILMISAMAFAMIWPGRPVVRGAIAGAAVAGSMAVGLEALPLFLVIWVMLGLRAAFDKPGARVFLAAFGGAMLVLAPLLMAGQTAPSEWLAPYCDELATPALALVAAGAAASMVPVLVGNRLSALPLAGVMLAVALAGCALAAPLLVPCLSGPYAALPAEVQRAISTQITEAQPGLLYLEGRPFGYAIIMVPALAAVAGAAILRWTDRDRLGAAQRDALDQMLVLGAIGVLATFSQIRMIHMSVPAVAFLGGFVLSRLAVGWYRGRSGRAALAMVAAMAATLFIQPVATGVTAVPKLFSAEAATGDPAAWDNGCRDAASLAELEALPPSTVLTTSNLAVPLILLTQHNGATAPYHRSAMGFWNEFFPYRSAENLKKTVQDADVDYVVVCRGSTYGVSLVMAHELLEGRAPDWLVPVLPEAKALAVFRVDRAAMGDG